MTEFANAVLDEETGELLEYCHLIMPGRNKGTNTIFFINKSEVPDVRWKDIAYSRIVCDVRPQKAEVNRTRLTYGDSNFDIVLDCGTPTADLLTVKLLLNSVISTPSAIFMTIDIKKIWVTKCGHNCPTIVGKKTQKTWIPPEQDNSRVLETQQETNQLFACGR